MPPNPVFGVEFLPRGCLTFHYSTLTDPDLGPLQDGQENAEDRSQTPGLANSSPSKKRLRRPWLRLSKSALNEILKHSQSNDIFIAHAKLKHLRGKNRLSSVGWVACIVYITLPIMIFRPRNFRISIFIHFLTETRVVRKMQI